MKYHSSICVVLLQEIRVLNFIEGNIKESRT